MPSPERPGSPLAQPKGIGPDLRVVDLAPEERVEHVEQRRRRTARAGDALVDRHRQVGDDPAEQDGIDVGRAVRVRVELEQHVVRHPAQHLDHQQELLGGGVVVAAGDRLLGAHDRADDRTRADVGLELGQVEVPLGLDLHRGYEELDVFLGHRRGGIRLVPVGEDQVLVGQKGLRLAEPLADVVPRPPDHRRHLPVRISLGVDVGVAEQREDRRGPADVAGGERIYGPAQLRKIVDRGADTEVAP